MQFFITKNDELSINTIRYIHEAKKIDMFSIFCFGSFDIFPHSAVAVDGVRLWSKKRYWEADLQLLDADTSLCCATAT